MVSFSATIQDLLEYEHEVQGDSMVETLARGLEYDTAAEVIIVSSISPTSRSENAGGCWSKCQHLWDCMTATA